MTQTAYPRFSTRDGAPTDEARLPAVFHERFLAHFIGQRTDDGIWPPHSESADARRWYSAGQDALYVSKDPMEAIRAYEQALDCDPGYLHAWVALAIAMVTENSEASLTEAERILAALSELPVGTDGLSGDAASIVAQNRAYIAFHRWRQGGPSFLLESANALYARGEELATIPRIEMMCPWAAVLIELGNFGKARQLLRSASRIDQELLREYAGKYPTIAEPIDSVSDRKDQNK